MTTIYSSHVTTVTDGRVMLRFDELRGGIELIYISDDTSPEIHTPLGEITDYIMKLARRKAKKLLAMRKLITLAEFKTLVPFHQGFAIYMQAEREGSELKGQRNPYPKGSVEDKQWRDGEQAAVLEVQGGGVREGSGRVQQGQ
jgi:hypothetical protein